MLIGGEKWACEACVRGHRVSNCQHSDRPLQHINKKGRPVSQCQHCRTLRKSRSAHVRCDCNGSRAHGKGACGLNAASQGNSCTCIQGGRCTCALKKELKNPVLGSDSDELPAIEKRRARTHARNLENRLTIFTNGHHKPAQKHNNTAQNYGSPYPIPKTRSLRGLSPSVVSHGSVESSFKVGGEDTKIEKKLIMNDWQEKFLDKSEQGSPSPSSVLSTDIIGGQHKSLNILLPGGEVNWPQSLDSVSSIPDSEQPIFSASLSATSIDWSHYDGLTSNNKNFTNSSFSQPPSYSGFDFSSIDQPALTSTSTSGELSEVEDFVPLAKNNASKPVPFGHKRESEQDASEFGGDVDSYRIGAASSYMSLPQTHIMANNMDDLDAFLKYSNALSSHRIRTPADDHSRTSQMSSPFDDSNFTLPSSVEDESEALWIGSFSPSNIDVAIGTNSTQSVLHDDFWVQ